MNMKLIHRLPMLMGSSFSEDRREWSRFAHRNHGPQEPQVWAPRETVSSTFPQLLQIAQSSSHFPQGVPRAPVYLAQPFPGLFKVPPRPGNCLHHSSAVEVSKIGGNSQYSVWHSLELNYKFPPWNWRMNRKCAFFYIYKLVIDIISLKGVRKVFLGLSGLFNALWTYC